MSEELKPEVIEAVQFNGTKQSVLDIMRLGSSRRVDVDCGGKELRIHTLEGVMIASLDDWIIKGIKDELYPCKSDIFEQTYEKVNE